MPRSVETSAALELITEEVAVGQRTKDAVA